MTDFSEFHSGNWTGFYLESHRPEPGWMHLYLTCDGEGLIRGEGVDYVGPWSLSGTFERKSRRCSWVKSYVGKHRVEYSGILGADGIEGSWRIPPFLSGSFRIWPEFRSDLTDTFLHAGLPRRDQKPQSVFEELDLPLLK
jgi:hypothetical protein